MAARIANDPGPGISARPVDDSDVMHLQAQIQSSQESPYQGGLYNLTVYKAMEEAIAQLADDRDEAEANRDVALLQTEELQSRIAELEHHLEQMQDKLQVSYTSSALLNLDC